jgi:hypothetical protein
MPPIKPFMARKHTMNGFFYCTAGLSGPAAYP